MPRSLIDRCQADSIDEFTSAATQRWHDAMTLLQQDRRTGAIYLFGYVVEMALKAAYFRFVGFPSAQAITYKDLKAAKGWSKVAGLTWQGNLHNLSSWAELLVTRRQTTPGGAYTIIGLGTQIKPAHRCYKDIGPRYCGIIRIGPTTTSASRPSKSPTGFAIGSAFFKETEHAQNHADGGT